MKVFQIGFNKCGTTSIHFRLIALGFSSVHRTTPDWQYVAEIMSNNLKHGYHILHGLDDYDAFTDIEYLHGNGFIEGYKYFSEIARQVPDAWFILNIRDRERWIASRLDHNNGKYAAGLLKLSGLPSLEALVESWRFDWDTHIGEVRRVVPAERLLILDIENEKMSKIDEFLGRSLVMEPLSIHGNFTRSALSRKIAKIFPAKVKKNLPKNWRVGFNYVLRKRR